MAGEFTDDGTETHFNIGSQPAYVKVKNFFIHLHSRIIEQSCNEDSSKIYVEGSVTDLLQVGNLYQSSTTLGLIQYQVAHKTTKSWIQYQRPSPSILQINYRALSKSSKKLCCNSVIESNFKQAMLSTFQAVSSGKRREGIIHTLLVHDSEVPEYFE